MDTIDFRQIARRYSFSEHAARADDYFGGLDANSAVARKPFASPHEAVILAPGIGVVVYGMRLFRGARVLDFGSGTGWLGRALAMMGCEVTSCDVSRNALAIGKTLAERDGLSVRFAPLDGPRLPFADGEFDRVVVFDALHHCMDQDTTVREFARVLKPDGIAAFHEPGPTHSLNPQSQYEMRAFDVIEGDVHLDALVEAGRDAGFADAKVALFAVNPVLLDVETFDRFLAGAAGGIEDAVRAESQNRRVFFLYKPDAGLSDSRSAVGLACRIEITGTASADGIDLRGTVTNIGTATWRPAGSGVGEVNLGVHLLDGSTIVNRDYARAALSATPLEPGQFAQVSATIPRPDLDPFTIAVDLVAEGVSWFEPMGSEPAIMRF